MITTTDQIAEAIQRLAALAQQPAQPGSSTRNRGQAASGVGGGESRLGGRPRRFGATQAGTGAW